ncbi:predicted protein [Nematostella vectensis]|uniref:ZMYM2-like/QRICH1 C-terminal domain-containing protein n=1 Tax=Nematostella vectensis TaxID=45351 RepID=A7RMY8_NEMVE|nr:zinc finger MYM-type protein 3 [Nematostella vectensis]EDO47179.1 predicted protein [Nematostella vectensis]|eukprot:XP_001639242.1 predicted protein [Nematostella vectensis]
MEGGINSFGIQINDITQDQYGFPSHLRTGAVSYKPTNTRIGPSVPSIYPSAESFLAKKNTEDVRSHFQLDGIGELEQEHGLAFSTSSATISENYLPASSSFNNPYHNSSHPYYSSLSSNSLSNENPAALDNSYHSRDTHGNSPYAPIAEYKTDSTLRIHAPSTLQQKPSNFMRSAVALCNLNPSFPDTASPMPYWPQPSEPKGSHAHFYPPRPFAYSTSLSSAFEHAPYDHTTESHQCREDKGLFRREHMKKALVGDSRELEDVDDANRCKNTVEGTKTSVRRFKKWYKDKTGKSLDMNAITKNMAVELLKDFFLEIRDTRPGKEGNEYEPVTLTTYRNGLRRYFLERKVPPAVENFDLADREFDVVNYGLVTKRNELKRKGKGNHPNVVESITETQLERMWQSGAIGVHAPRPLLRLQWWINTVCHGIRGRMAHHDLSIDDFRISRGADGKIVIDHIKAGSKRPRAGSDEKEINRNKKKCKAKVTATDGGERDPVRAFEVYLRHRPPGISSFYLTPKHKPKGDVWFNKVPMGKNSIGRIMREIKAIAGIG